MGNRIVINLDAEDRATPAFEKFQSGVADNLRKATVAHKTLVDKALASVKSYESRMLASLEPVIRMYSAVDRSIRTVNKALEANRRSVEEALKPLERFSQELSTVHTRLKQVLEVFPNGTHPTGGAGLQKHPVQQANFWLKIGKFYGFAGKARGVGTPGRIGKDVGIGLGTGLAVSRIDAALYRFQSCRDSLTAIGIRSSVKNMVIESCWLPLISRAVERREAQLLQAGLPFLLARNSRQPALDWCHVAGRGERISMMTNF